MNLIKSDINGYYSPEDPGEPGGGKRLSVNDEEARIIATFCKGKRVLEIGTGLGVATRIIAKAASHVVTIDIDPFVIENVFPALMEYRNIDCLTIPQTDLEFFDACLIDGLHTYDQCIEDIQTAHARVKKGGLLIFHDYHMMQVRCAIYDSGLDHFYIKSTAGIAIAWNE